MNDEIMNMTPEEAYELGYTRGSKRDWIPCADRMPEADVLKNIKDRFDLKRYLVTIEYVSKVDNFTYVKELAYVKDYIGFPATEHTGWFEYTSGSWFASGRITAWMPKPKPYSHDHIPDATKKVDQLREPTKMMEVSHETTDL